MSRIRSFKLAGHRLDEQEISALFAEAMTGCRRSASGLVRLAVEEWLEVWASRGKPCLLGGLDLVTTEPTRPEAGPDAPARVLAFRKRAS